ncbi:MAG: DUF732 domain-containing protein [Mycobacterium sp.]|jgi:hypothetical protein
MKKAIVLGVVGIAAVSGIAMSAPAAASTDAAADAAFLAAVRDGGISGSFDTLIQSGKEVCRRIDVLGMTPLAVQRDVYLETDLDRDHSIWFTIAAINSYCPWNTNLMPGQTDATQEVRSGGLV